MTAIAMAPPLSWPPFTYFLLSRGLWISSATQFLTNLGWAFLITWLPSYLKEKYFVESTTLSLMASLPIFVGMAGMYGGGWLTDHWTAHVGRLVARGTFGPGEFYGGRRVRNVPFYRCPLADNLCYGTGGFLDGPGHASHLGLLS